MDEYEFYAETSSGHTIKVLTDLFYNCFSNETFMTLSGAGIFSSRADELETTLINAKLYMGNFDNYKCKQERTVALNLTHYQKFLKGIKKKDSLTLFVYKKDTKMGIRVKSTSNTKETGRVATNYIQIRDVMIQTFDEIQGYHYPKVIASTDFQKMCKEIGIIPAKEMEITIQKENYVRFFCDGGEVMKADSEFGCLDKNDKEIYSETFYISTITQLVKATGLFPKMQIHAPKHKQYPVKIKINAGTLGEVEIFIKSKSQIEFEGKKK